MVSISSLGRPVGVRVRSGVAAALALLSLMVFLGAAPGVREAQAAPENFADLAEKLLPSVVNISTTQTVEAGRQMEMPQFPEGSPFEDFFKDFFDQRGPRSPHKAMSLGSGFIVDPSGFIVTNYHVIKDAEDISVTIHNDLTLKAEVVGADEKTDLALLKVKSDTPLPAVRWGDSDKARVGEWVVAIGNPFGLGGTVTSGIISAKTRDINAGPYDSFIQTDASINKGNSGGPLFNAAGEVIGINTVIFSPSGGSVGIGFAVPANIARKVITDLKDHGRTRRGWIGVRIQSVTDDISENLGLPNTKGALVAAVNDGGPAKQAGIRVGDVILSFDGREVPEMRSLPRFVIETQIGKTVPVDIWRSGKRETVQLKIEELEKAEEDGKLDDTPAAAPSTTASLNIKPLGVSVSRIDDSGRRRFNLDEGLTDGVVVTQVDQNADAFAKGIRPGTVIVRAGQKDVAAPEDLTALLTQAKNEGRKTLLLLVDNRGTRTFVAVKIDDEDKSAPGAAGNGSGAAQPDPAPAQ